VEINVFAFAYICMSLSSVLWLVLQILYLEFVCMNLYIWMLLWLSVIPQNLDEKKKPYLC